MTSAGELISVGCNDVPKAGGGLFWPGDPGDDRDFQIGYDNNARAKVEILAEVLKALDAARVFDKGDRDLSDLASDLLHGPSKQEFEGIQLSSLLEFGRIVHAEMAAISEAARLGIPLRGATLYCTTFPCHLCARLIIAAGIARVVYIEPYPKSKTGELYSATVRIDVPRDPQGSGTSHVHFESFVGVAPTRFMQLFKMSRRKDQRGDVVGWDKNAALPKFRRFVPSYIVLEQAVITAVPDKLREVGLNIV